jgi:phage baseplate assembly protein W
MAINAARTDYAFPFRISVASGQAAQTDYATHAEEMVRQLLLTAPGERVNLPEFGCGLRRLLFAGSSAGRPLPPGQPNFPGGDAVSASAQILVQQALSRWLAGQVEVKQVRVLSGTDAPEGQLIVEVHYLLVETRDLRSTTVRLM